MVRSSIDGFSSQHWNTAYVLRQWTLDYLVRAMKEVAVAIEGGGAATSVPDYFALYWRKPAPEILVEAGRAASVRNAPAPVQVGGWSNHPTALAMQSTTQRIEGKHTVIQLQAQNDNPAAYVTQASPLSFPRMYSKIRLTELSAVCDRAKDQARSQGLMLELKAADWKGVDWTVDEPENLSAPVTVPEPVSLVVFAAKYGNDGECYPRLGVAPVGDVSFLWDDDGMVGLKTGRADVRMWEREDAIPLDGGVSLDMERLAPAVLLSSTELVTEVLHTIVDGNLIICQAEWEDMLTKLAEDRRPSKMARTSVRCNACDCLLVLNSKGKPVCRIKECVQDMRSKKAAPRVYSKFQELKGALTWEQCMDAH